MTIVSTSTSFIKVVLKVRKTGKMDPIQRGEQAEGVNVLSAARTVPCVRLRE